MRLLARPATIATGRQHANPAREPLIDRMGEAKPASPCQPTLTVPSAQSMKFSLGPGQPLRRSGSIKPTQYYEAGSVSCLLGPTVADVMPVRR
jgi:hypothetical protein